jgi:hypothetical protein
MFIKQEKNNYGQAGHLFFRGGISFLKIGFGIGFSAPYF